MPGIEVGPISAELSRACHRAVAGGGPISILFSGGLDSSLLAHVLREAGPRLVTIGTEGSSDARSAIEAGRLLGIPVELHRIARVDVSSALHRWGSELLTVREPSRSVAVSLALALATCRDRVVACGQGADELFHGYAHFRGLSSSEAGARARDDWERLTQTDWPLAQRLAQELGHRLVSPYLDAQFVESTRELPPEVHVFEGESKPFLRRVAEGLGLPVPLVRRPKKAMQYGTGVARLIREVERTRRTPSGP